MARLIRSAKSANAWTTGDLDSYNITLLPQDAMAFFEIQQLPQTQVHPEILTVQNSENMAIAANQELVTLLEDAMVEDPVREEAPVNDFAVQLLRTLHFSLGRRICHVGKDLHLIISGERRHAKPDICIVDHNQHNTLPLIQENKRVGSSDLVRENAGAQLIAEAIAAFTWNNCRRQQGGLPLLEQQVCAGHLSP